MSIHSYFVYADTLVVVYTGGNDAAACSIYDVSDLDNPRIISTRSDWLVRADTGYRDVGLPYAEEPDVDSRFYLAPELVRVEAQRLGAPTTHFLQDKFLSEYRMVDFKNPAIPSVVSTSTIVKPYFHFETGAHQTFNGKYMLGEYSRNYMSTRTKGHHGKNADCILLEPTFIEFPEVQVYPSPDSFFVSWQGGTARSNMEMDKSTIATTWSANRIDDGSWLTMTKENAVVAPSSGDGRVDAGSLTLEYDVNPTPFTRTAQITVAAASPKAISVPIALQQEGLGMIVSPLEINAEPAGGDVVLTLDIANYPTRWYAVIEGDAPWVTMGDTSKTGEGNGSISLAISENTSGQPRIAMMRLWTDIGHEETVSVRQRSYVPGELTVNPTVIRSDSSQQLIDIEVINIGETSIEWTASISGGSWVNLVESPSSTPVQSIIESDTHLLTLDVRENSMRSQRRGVLQIQPNDESLPAIFVPIVQEGLFSLTDTNRDGHVSAADIQVVINAVTNGDNSCDCADINGDGLVNALDIQAVINAVLGMKAIQ